jgi:MFS family permease
MAAAVTTPLVGRLGDIYGKRRLLLVCIQFLVCGALVCALSSSIATVVAGRAMQGMGLGLIPIAISLMRDVLPTERVDIGVALTSASLGMGGALGLPLSAVVAQALGWHALFWCTAVLGATFGGLVLLFVPESPVRTLAPVDMAGALGLALGVGAYLLAVSKGAEWGWTSTATMTLLVTAPVVLAGWTAWELKVAHPVVDLRTCVNRTVLATNLCAMSLGIAMYSMNLLAPRLLQLPIETGYGLGLDMVHTGLWMIPGGAGMMLLSPLAARVIASKGPRRSLAVGTVVIGCGNLLALVSLGEIWGVVAFVGVVSAGVAYAYAAFPTLIMRAVDITQTGAANGLNHLSRTLGTATASALVGAVLGQLTTTVHGTTVPSEAGIRVALLIAAGSAVLAATASWFIPGTRRPGGPVEPSIVEIVTG